MLNLSIFLFFCLFKVDGTFTTLKFIVLPSVIKVELLGAIHYIVPKVMSRNFIDEDVNEIKNKYGYFKNAMESNFNKLNNLGKELYPDDLNDKFWDDYEL